MKIGIVRGPFLNKWEMQNYEPLLEKYSVTAFTTTNHWFPLDEIKLPLKKLFSIDTIFSLISLQLANIFNRICNRFFGWNYYMFGLKNQLKDFDIVNTVELHHTFTNQVINAKKKYGFKVVVTVWENIPFIWDRHSLRKKNKQNVIKNADLFIAVTEKIKQTLILEGVPEEKIVVLNYGIDLNRFKPEDKNIQLLNKIGINKEDFIILFIGRFVWEKGIYDLIFSAKKILCDNDIKFPIKFVFVGSGQEKKNMIALIKRLGISESVKIVPGLAYELMPDVHNLADIFVLPSIPTRSWQEQFGMVLIESIACAKPVIATLSGSIPEVVGDAAILVPPADYMTLYKEIKNLVLNKDLRDSLKIKSRARAENFFSINSFVKKVKEVIGENK